MPATSRCWLIFPPEGANGAARDIIRRAIPYKDIDLTERPAASMEVADGRVHLSCTGRDDFFQRCQNSPRGIDVFSTASLHELLKFEGQVFHHRGLYYQCERADTDRAQDDMGDPYQHRMLCFKPAGRRLAESLTELGTAIHEVQPDQMPTRGSMFIHPERVDLDPENPVASNLFRLNAMALEEANVTFLPPWRSAGPDSYWTAGRLRMRHQVRESLRASKRGAWPLALVVHSYLDDPRLRPILMDGGEVDLRHEEGRSTRLVLRVCTVGDESAYRWRFLNSEARRDDMRDHISAEIAAALQEDLWDAMGQRVPLETTVDTRDWSISRPAAGTLRREPGAWELLGGLARDFPSDLRRDFTRSILAASKRPDGFDPHLATELFITQYLQPPSRALPDGLWRSVVDTLLSTLATAEGDYGPRVLSVLPGVEVQKRDDRTWAVTYVRGGKAEPLHLRLLAPERSTVRHRDESVLGETTILGEGFRLT